MKKKRPTDTSGCFDQSIQFFSFPSSSLAIFVHSPITMNLAVVNPNFEAQKRIQVFRSDENEKGGIQNCESYAGNRAIVKPAVLLRFRKQFHKMFWTKMECCWLLMTGLFFLYMLAITDYIDHHHIIHNHQLIMWRITTSLRLCSFNCLFSSGPFQDPPKCQMMIFVQNKTTLCYCLFRSWWLCVVSRASIVFW